MEEHYPTLRSGLADSLKLIINDVAQIEHHLDFVSITGDLTEAADAESYHVLHTLLAALSIPVFVIPGNHDLRSPLRKVFSSHFIADERETLDYQATFERVQVLGLDTVIEGEVSGRLTQRQLSWLHDLLTKDEFTHTVVSMHHPPFPIGQAEFDRIATLEGREQFGKLIRRSKSEVTVLCGHVHRPYQAIWNRANCIIAGSPASQVGSQFCFGNDSLDFVDEHYFYFIHDINELDGHRIGLQYVSL